jgi:hypothetical protein
MEIELKGSLQEYEEMKEDYLKLNLLFQNFEEADNSKLQVTLL